MYDCKYSFSFSDLDQKGRINLNFLRVLHHGNCLPYRRTRQFNSNLKLYFNVLKGARLCCLKTESRTNFVFQFFFSV